MAQGFAQAKTMFDTLRQAAEKEESWPVLGRMLQVATLPLVPGSAVAAPVWQYAQQESTKIIQAKWMVLCRAVRAGKLEGIHVGRAGIAAWKNIQLIDPDTKETAKTALQGIVDVVWCAGRAFDDAGGKGRVAQGATLLLRDAEKALNEILKQNVADIHKALQATGDAVGAGVREAVLDRAEALEKSHEIVVPTDSRFKEAPAKPPAKPPAKAPATP